MENVIATWALAGMALVAVAFVAVATPLVLRERRWARYPRIDWAGLVEGAARLSFSLREMTISADEAARRMTYFASAGLRSVEDLSADVRKASGYPPTLEPLADPKLRAEGELT